LKCIGSGTNLVDTIYIDNAAEAHVLAAARLAQNPDLSGRIYFLSQGEPTLAWDMINAILRAAGRPPVNGAVPYPLARLLGTMCELAFNILRLPGEPPMTRFVVDALAKSHWFNIEAARQDLEYTPRVSTPEGMKRLEYWIAATYGRGERQ
jgi:nucleoside-diphosphate-sugar epimerase